MSEFEDTMEWAASIRLEAFGRECSRCGIPEKKCPLAGFDAKGRCLVCRDYLEEQRPVRISERLRAKLSGDSAEQASIEVFA